MAIGWVAAVISLIVIGLVFGAIFGVAPETDDPGAGVAIGGLFATLLTGFLANGVGGYVAAKRAGINGPLNGTMVAIFGIVVVIALAVILAILGVVAGLIFSGGQVTGLQSITTLEGVGLASGGALATIAVLIANILGGYVGGKISGPEEEGGSGPRQSRVR